MDNSKEFRVVGGLMPSEFDIDSRCPDCFPGDGLVVRTAGKFEQLFREPWALEEELLRPLKPGGLWGAILLGIS